jgi:hypothetical protein
MQPKLLAKQPRTAAPPEPMRTSPFTVRCEYYECAGSDETYQPQRKLHLYLAAGRLVPEHGPA